MNTFKVSIEVSLVIVYFLTHFALKSIFIMNGSNVCCSTWWMGEYWLALTTLIFFTFMNWFNVFIKAWSCCSYQITLSTRILWSGMQVFMMLLEISFTSAFITACVARICIFCVFCFYMISQTPIRFQFVTALRAMFYNIFMSSFEMPS